MWDSLMDALGSVGHALDTPRRLLYEHAISPMLGTEVKGAGDVLGHLGMDMENPLAKALGFVGDMATDPLTYLGALGGSALGRRAFQSLGPRLGANPAKLAEAVAAGGRPAEMAESLLASPSAKRLLHEVPGGSTLLEGSNNALAFKTPQGDVLRMAQGQGGMAPGSRAAIPEMMQPTRNVPVGDWRVERVPFAENVGDRGLFRDAYKEMTEGIRGAGGHPADFHPGNLGLGPGGRPVLIDPGAVVQRPGGAPLPLAPLSYGATPGKYFYGGAGAGAGSSSLLKMLLGTDTGE